jgi:tetratricopeptide (TPR) repeat protein
LRFRLGTDAVSIRQSIGANHEAAVAQAVNDFLQKDLLAQASAATQTRPSTKPDPHLEVRTALDRAAGLIGGKFDGQPEVEAAIRDTIGQTYEELGLSPEARTQLERALDLQRRVLGAENPQCIKTMSRLGRIADLQGKYAEAEALLSRALAIQRRVLSPERPDTPPSRSAGQPNLGDRTQDVGSRPSLYGGEYEQSGGHTATGEIRLGRDLRVASPAGRRHALGSGYPDTMASAADVALVYLSQGKFNEGEPWCARRCSGPKNRPG